MAKDLLEELVTKFTFDVDQAGLNSYLRGQQKMNAMTKTSIGLNRTLGRTMRNLFLGAGAVFGIKGLISNYRDLDLTRRSIEGLTKSTQDWDYIQKEAIRTGTGINAVAKGYRNFYSAASMAGFGKEGIQEMYSNVLTASRAIGASQQQVSGALLALEQMLSKGRVSMEELRRQLGNALPGAFEIGAKAMGVTTQKFNEMVKAGISAQEFVPKFTRELLKTYGDAFPEAIKSLDFAMVNLDTTWKLFLYDLMKGKAGQEIAKVFNDLATFLQSGTAKDIAAGIGKGLQLVAHALQFVVKHIRLILFLFGVATLLKGAIVLNNLRWRILDITTAMNNGLHPALQKVAENLSSLLFYGGGLKPVLASLWKACLPFLSLAWKLFLLYNVLYIIYLLVEDIFSYINHPEWDSFTKRFVEKSPVLKKAIQDIRDIFKELEPVVSNLNDICIKLFRNIVNFLHNHKEGITSILRESIIGISMLIDNIMVLIKTIVDLLKKLHLLKDELPEEQKEKPETKTRTIKDVLASGGMGLATLYATKSPQKAWEATKAGYILGSEGTGALIRSTFVPAHVESLKNKINSPVNFPQGSFDWKNTNFDLTKTYSPTFDFKYNVEINVPNPVSPEQTAKIATDIMGQKIDNVRTFIGGDKNGFNLSVGGNP